jgi:superfamily I DNA/RNA helicase
VSDEGEDAGAGVMPWDFSGEEPPAQEEPTPELASASSPATDAPVERPPIEYAGQFDDLPAALDESTLNDAQRAAAAHVSGPLIVFAGAGSGKCLGRGTPVLLHSGEIKAVELVVAGDRLMGPDSKPRNVLSTSNGRGPLYRIDPVKGDSWVCNDAHIMTLTGTNRERGRIIDIPLLDLLEKYKNYSRPDKNWKLWRTGVSFHHKEVPFDPYFIGLWLGNGALGAPSITSCEPELIVACEAFATSIGARCHITPEPRNNTNNIRINFDTVGRGHRSPLISFLKEHCERDGFKSMPDLYRINSEEVRLQILAGLMDTDGHLADVFEYTSISHRLIEQIVFLARSLGLAAYSNDKFAKKLAPNTTYRRVTISGDLDRIPTRLPRRVANERKQIKRVTCTGFSATPIGQGDYFGFELDGDGRFLLGDFTVTHNTKSIVHRIARLVIVEGVPAYSILAVTFTNKAAAELRARLDLALGPSAKELWVGTFHATCARILRRFHQAAGLRPGFSIYDTSDQRRLVRRALLDCDLEADRATVERAASRITHLKQEGGTAADLIDPRDEVVQRIVRAYQKRLADANAVDYDDLLLRVLALAEGRAEGKESKASAKEGERTSDAGRAVRRLFRHVLVDEFQDANRVQYRLARALSAETENLCVVGDDDQCHPPGVLIDVAGVDVPVEELAAFGAVRGWDRETGARRGRLTRVARRAYKGKMYTVTCAGRDVPVTGNHKLLVRWSASVHPDRTKLGVFEIFAEDLDGMLGGSVAMGGLEMPLAGDDGGWAPIDAVRWRPYEGFVYSLDVETDHAYAANGLIVGNSIYKWRGAVPAIFDQFRVDHPNTKVVLLEQNYRSTGSVVAAASALIAKAEHRAPKTLWTAKPPGDPVYVVVCATEADEARFVVRRVEDALVRGIKPTEIAVLYRVHAQSRALEEALRTARLAYRVLGGQRFYERTEVKDVVSYLRLAANPTSDVDVLRVLNVPPRGIGDTTAERLARAARDLKVSIHEAAVFLRGEPNLGAETLGRKGWSAVSEFATLVDHLVASAEENPTSPTMVLARALGLTGYVELLRKGDPADADARVEVLQELAGTLLTYEEEASLRGELPSLAGYLERVALDAGDEKSGSVESVSLMTVHAAKGLEFEEVILTGMEEGIFPYIRQTDAAVEEGCDEDEERRLAYVAMTRAKTKLFVSWAQTRQLYGTTRVGIPSRFLADLPPQVTRRGRSAGVSPERAKELQAPKEPPRVIATPEPKAPDGPATPSGLRAGLHVVHRAWGLGRVTSIDGEFVLAKFPAHGERRVHESYVRAV